MLHLFERFRLTDAWNGTGADASPGNGNCASPLLTSEDYKGQLAPAETIRYRNPHVLLYNEYIVISDPGTDQKDKVIPRESLIELQWKK